MEQRMLVVVFNGNELPDEALVKINGIIAKNAFAHPDDVIMHTLDEKQLAKLVAKQIISEHTPQHQKELGGDRIIKAIAKKYDLNNKVTLTIQLTSDLLSISERIRHGKAITWDNEFVNMLKSLIQHGYYHSDIASRYGYIDDVKDIISQIYYKFFDENGKPKQI